MTESQELVPRVSAPVVTVTWIEERREHYGYLLGLGKGLFENGMLPEAIKTAQAAALTMLVGHEYGWGPMASIRFVTVVEGKSAVYADGMTALVRREKAGSFSYEMGDGFCKLTGRRNDNSDTYMAEWNRKRAARAGLDTKQNWRKYETDMLRERCEAEVCRALFSDLLGGTYTPEELEDSTSVEEEPQAETRTDQIKHALGVPQTAEQQEESTPDDTESRDSTPDASDDGTPGAADDPPLSGEDMAEVDAEVQTNLLEDDEDE